jgi:hypothetical protein
MSRIHPRDKQVVFDAFVQQPFNSLEKNIMGNIYIALPDEMQDEAMDLAYNTNLTYKEKMKKAHKIIRRYQKQNFNGDKRIFPLREGGDPNGNPITFRAPNAETANFIRSTFAHGWAKPH